MTGHKISSKIVIAGVVTLATAATAQAGGFSRGSANLDPLFGDGAFGLHAGVTYVAPRRAYSNVQGGTIVGGVPTTFSQDEVRFGSSFAVPSVSAGGRVVGDLRCVGSYSQPYGADAEYEGAITFHIAEQTLSSHEYGLTCGYGFDAGPGRLSVIGGAFYETIKFGQARNFETALGWPGDSRVDLSSQDWGYRVGLGYEIPEIALKATLMYRSQTTHNASGWYTNTPFAILSGVPLYGDATSAPASASASLPQSLELNVQSGIAPGWLAFGSVKWTDWSVLESLQVQEGILGATFSETNFFFRDGWTITGGIGHQITDDLAGSLAVTWDKGVTTGWDALSDNWTFGGGLSYDINDNAQIRLGGAAIYFTSATKSEGAYTAVAPSNWGYALSASTTLRF